MLAPNLRRTWRHWCSLISITALLLPLRSSGQPIRPELASALKPAMPLEEGWASPPLLARTRVWWWWLNGNVDKATITRDLQEMKAKGMGGANIIDAGGDNQRNHRRVPHGPDFASPAWRELFAHAVAEADRLGLELGLNIQSGWNLGGPTVKAEQSAKTITVAEQSVTGGQRVELTLKQPTARDGFYRDVAVLAYPARGNTAPRGPGGIPNFAQKAYITYPGAFTAPATWHLLDPGPPLPENEVIRPAEVIDLTARMDASGKLAWDAPAGEWAVLRIGYTLKGSHVSTASEGGEGWAIDYLDADAFETYWQQIMEPILAAVRPHLGRSLRFLHTDSWELGPVNWTPRLPDEFKRRRGYDLTPYLPVFANRVIGNREIATRFLNDFRRTLAELIAENKYLAFSRHARAVGLGIHPESGGPHAAPIDALKNLGLSDVAMGEFWAPSPTHRIVPEQRYFVKQTSSAAHTYGLRISLAEAFTSIGPQWEEDPRSLKSTFDRALCEGHNLTMWHTFDCSPASMGVPGQAYFAGSHLNPNVTWWPEAGAFIAFMNRCHFMLQQGLPVSDVLHFYGENIPSFVRLKTDDPARAAPEYDYDVINLDALLTRTGVDRTGRVVLPDGTSYALLSLERREALSLPALRHVAQLVEQGATVVGARPQRQYSLSGYPKSDVEFAELAGRLWPATDAGEPARRGGRGAVLSDPTARAALQRLGVARDFEWKTAEAEAFVDYIHRRTDGAEIYYIANRHNRRTSGTAVFRVRRPQPEIWDPVTATRWLARSTPTDDSRTAIDLQLDPEQSLFVVFQAKGSATETFASGKAEPSELLTLGGAWTVSFDPKWGGPAQVEFQQLEDWSKRPEEGIRHYSGAAWYEKSFTVGSLPAGKRVQLDLGELRNLASVTLNGRDLGVLWMSPFRVDVTDALRAGENRLRVKIVNLWPNRLIGDQRLTPEARRTKTNITKFEQAANQKLLPSGLFGPVRLVVPE